MYTIVSVDARVTPVATRIPFRYGIAQMTEAPHVVIEVELCTPVGTSRGWASEHLPPKWFTKDPGTSFVDDIGDMVTVITHAVDAAIGRHAETVFALWRDLDRVQTEWAALQGIPGLLSGLGTALVERALIDAACRAHATPLIDALHEGTLGFDPGALHPELRGIAWSDLLPRTPATSIAIRHTIGLADALTDDEAVDDAPDHLPVSLEGTLARYGATHLKIKTTGDLAGDTARLARIIDLTEKVGSPVEFTIDGNESMTDADHFLSWILGLLSHPVIGSTLSERLIAVEQPFHRSMATSPAVRRALAQLGEQVAVIIDESDDRVEAVRDALDAGYAGGTYKGCKGVFRGLANGVLIASRSASRRLVFTAEDLSTLPPLTVAQDVVVSLALGLTHIERNGHHYFARLAPLGPTTDEDACTAHPETYERDGDGRVRLRIQQGRIDATSLLRAPFGFAPDIQLGSLAKLSTPNAVSGLSRH